MLHVVEAVHPCMCRLFQLWPLPLFLLPDQTVVCQSSDFVVFHQLHTKMATLGDRGGAVGAGYYRSELTPRHCSPLKNFTPFPVGESEQGMPNWPTQSKSRSLSKNTMTRNTICMCVQGKHIVVADCYTEENFTSPHCVCDRASNVN